MTKFKKLISELQNLTDKEKFYKILKIINTQLFKDVRLCHKLAEFNLELATENGWEIEKAIALKEIGLVYKTLSFFPKALEYFTKALEFFEKDHNDISKAEILVYIASIHNLQGESEQSVQLNKDVLTIYQKAEDEQNIAQTFYNLGNSYYQLSEFNKSLDYYAKCLKIAQKLKDNKLIADCYNDCGLVYLTQGNYEKSLSYFIKTLKIREETNDDELKYISISNIGNVYYYLGNSEKALEYYQRSVELLNKKVDKQKYSQILNNMGSIYYKLEKYDKAEQFFKESLQIKKELSHKKGIAVTLSNLGEIALLKKDYNKALQFYSESIQIREEIGDKVGLAISLLNVVRVKLHIQDISEILTYIDKAQTIAEETDTIVIIESCCELRSKYYKAIKDYKKALEFHELFVDKKEEVFNREFREKISEMQTKYETEKAERDAEIFKLKNVELVKANEDIKLKNEELNNTKNHLKFINKILRHDLINNLSSIKSSLKIFEIENNKDILQHAHHGIQKSIDLIRRMHDLESVISDHANMKIVDIRSIIEKVASSFKNMKITICGTGEVLADDTINSVIENIIGNAVRHSKTDKIEISISNNNKYCKIDIADFGIGIADEFKEKIFEESFVMGKTAHTGLGLYIVKKTMENYGGLVFVEDNQPQGAKFVILLRRVK